MLLLLVRFSILNLGSKFRRLIPIVIIEHSSILSFLGDYSHLSDLHSGLIRESLHVVERRLYLSLQLLGLSEQFSHFQGVKVEC